MTSTESGQAASHAADDAPDARAKTWRSMGVRHYLINLLLCTGIAAFLSVVFNGVFWRNLVFSVCIGLCIQLLIDVGRHLLSRWRVAMGHEGPELREGWPGWRYMAGWVLLSALLGYSVGMTLGGWLTGEAVPLFDLDRNGRALFIVLTITLLVSVGFTAYFYTSGRLESARAQAAQAERLASEHELKLLQSQLEPHMLFNTLANLRVLIGIDTARAQTMLDHMVAYLRATLAASREPLHPLSAEFDRLGDYLALMAVRMGPRLSVTLDLPDALRDRPVPPLLLQPLVENSIQHGLEPKVGPGRICVRARRDGDELVLTVCDTGVGMPTASPARTAPAATPGAHATPRAPATGASRTRHRGGFGTAQVRERLQVLYGDKACFTLTSPLPVGAMPAQTLKTPNAPPASTAPATATATADAEDGGTLAEIRMPWAPPGHVPGGPA